MIRNKLTKLDASLSAQLRIAEKPGLLRYAAILLAHSGDSWFWIAAILLVFFLGNQYWKSLASLMGGSVLITAFTVFIIKFSVKRKRPEGDWGRIYRSTDPHSFPSGHAARAFMLALIAIGSGPIWLAFVLVIWAPLVGIARISMGVHYFSDVFAGALLGAIMGFINLSIVPKGLELLSNIQ
jgi:undecaprenyl-diphosphatase